MTAPEVINFGCRLNLFEAEVIRRSAEAAGLQNAIIVNTCAVTSEAERQARQAIRRARRDHPGCQVIVTGCAVQIAPDRYAAMPEVDRVIGNREKLLAESYRSAASRLVSDIAEARETAPHLIDGISGHARAFLEVQQGCDHRCTFCVIPLGRGPSRSVPAGEVVERARALVKTGHNEIVLTGVDLTAYGEDLPGKPNLGQLARRLLKLVPELKRLRLSSLDPVEIDEDLWRLLAEEPRLMPHLHLSIQSGDDLILKRMKRRHSRQEALSACAKARDLRPGVALGADFIAGFPTENEAMFANTLSLAEEAELDYLHVFPYSARDLTPAARMPQVRGDTIRERAARLRELGGTALARSLAARIGSTALVLAEGDGTSGHSEHHAPVRLPHSIPRGSVLEVRLAASTGATLIGEAL